MEAFLNQLPIGLSIGAVLLLIALGLTFTFGQMGVINMAHGEFIMAGAYTPYMLQTSSIGLFAGATGAGANEDLCLIEEMHASRLARRRR